MELAARLFRRARKLASRVYWWSRRQPRLWNPLRLYHRARSAAFDWRHGLDTRRIVERDCLDTPSPNLEHGTRYQPSNLGFVAFAVRRTGIDCAAYTFIDFGSGRGRVLLEASEHPFREVIGVEFSASLHEACQRVVRRYLARTGRGGSIRPYLGDAASFEIPRTDLVLYFYHPFDAPVMRRVLANVETRLAADVRDVRVFYLNPVCEDLFRESRWFELQEAGRYGDDRYCIFRSRGAPTPQAG